MKLGYNTNGFAHHRIGDAVAAIAEIGYESVALTLEHDVLDPPDRGGVARCLSLLKPIIDDAGLSVTVETGSRFILDPRRKHQPTLISASADDRARRIEFLRAAVEVAAGLGADSVSLWSGAPDEDGDEDVLFSRLCGGLRAVLTHAEPRDVRLSFEPEPGMFIDTMPRFAWLVEAVDHPSSA